MQLTPSKVRQLIELSLVIEPLLDKKDCTTRYIDLPGKPLQDFLIASVNVGMVFEEFAQSILNGNTAVFSHFSRALEVSNEYKSRKTINFGLIEILLPAVQAVMKAESIDRVVTELDKALRESSRQDVEDELAALTWAWQTSVNPEKRLLMKRMQTWFKPAQSYYERCVIFQKHLDDPASSNYQVMYEMTQGFPILSRFLAEIDDKKGLMKSLEDTYNDLHRENPLYKVGWLADLCACASFMYLAFQSEEYVIQ